MKSDVTESAGGWQRGQVPFPMSVDAIAACGYKLKSKILANKGVSLKHIEQQSGAERVFLRLGEEGAPCRSSNASSSSSGAMPAVPVSPSARAGASAAPATPATPATPPGAATSTELTTPPSESEANGAAPSADEPAGASNSKGSGLERQPSSGRASGTAPAAVLHVVAGSDTALRRAVELCEELFEKIRADITRWNSLPPEKRHGGGWSRQASFDGATRPSNAEGKSLASGGSGGNPQRYGADGRVVRSESSNAVFDLSQFIKPNIKKSKSSSRP